ARRRASRLAAARKTVADDAVLAQSVRMLRAGWWHDQHGTARMLGHVVREAASQQLLRAGEAAGAQHDDGGADLLGHLDHAVPATSRTTARPFGSSAAAASIAWRAPFESS